MVYLFLAAAIGAEVVGAIATRYSDGFTRLVPTVIAVVGVLGAYFLLSLTLKQGMGIGVAYGIWAAAGVTLVAVIGALFLGDHLTWLQVVGVALVIVGVLALEHGGTHEVA
ncbi:DMT family transporter [Cryobacterium psychrophilum]|uniref:Multidrug efflux SMR transporter n=1 Tax=Cryobacterium psychrophilum TaxID=41988 RepID=A0A4Y8KWD4_9MICO|nr:multidrug efflux SMR transporter [Cryobacterium psychrophilum]TDW30955.1 small multidrug resistance pump [Cryobacterium psychrophilum]TFD80821.1 multidrug efflux SMR transporter [Cryobacterium psychrophilum]